MAFGISKPRLSPIAVDFGADRLKVFQVVPGDPPQLVAAAAAAIPAEARASIAARMAFLGSALRQLLKAQPFKGRRAICSIPAHQTLIQHIEVSRVEGAELNNVVGMHLMERLAVDPNRMVIRATPVGQHQRNGVMVQEVSCMAAPREVVMGYIKLAEQAKLDVVGMHTEPAAILRAFESTYSRRAEDKTRVACFIDIGAKTTKVVIAQGFDLKFAKAIPIGGDEVTRMLSEKTGLSFDEARKARLEGQTDVFAPAPDAGCADQLPTGRERRRNMIEHRTTGLPILDAMEDDDEPITPAPRGSGGGTALAAKPRQNPVDAAEAEMVDTLVDELRLCLRHYQSLAEDRPVDRLIFLGGEANHTRVCQQIARKLHIAAQLGDPFARLVRIGAAKAATGVNLDQPQPGWAVPFGLCHCEANL